MVKHRVAGDLDPVPCVVHTASRIYISLTLFLYNAIMSISRPAHCFWGHRTCCCGGFTICSSMLSLRSILLSKRFQSHWIFSDFVSLVVTEPLKLPIARYSSNGKQGQLMIIPVRKPARTWMMSALTGHHQRLSNDRLLYRPSKVRNGDE